jgi:hypothetical protein
MFIILLTGSLPHHRGARLSVGSGGQMLQRLNRAAKLWQRPLDEAPAFFNRQRVRAVKKPQFHCTDTGTPLIHRRFCDIAPSAICRSATV